MILTSCVQHLDATTSDTLCFTCTNEDCQKYASTTPSELTGGLFKQGEIDLTGDGLLEHVKVEHTHVIIYQNGVEVWRNPETWDIVDVALGDPNDDGRSEVLVVFWREDETGQRINQPFIVGYRGGHYRELWGGSPVGSPIAEVELADITGDGRQDILVLEATEDSEKRTIAVWQWQQWWFSYVWRSEGGAYHDLQAGQDAKQQTLMCVMEKNS